MKQRKPAGPGARPTTPRLSNLDSVLVGLAALIVYLLFAPPVSGDKDASEFTLVLATNGVAHPTGYPLYTILGHLFVTALHALGTSWSYAANAFSAVGGGLAIGFLHALSARIFPAGVPNAARRWIAFVPVAILALNPIWTVEATLAEVYSWHLAWTLGLACLFVSTLPAFARADFSDRDLTRRSVLWGFLCGVGLAHHATSVLVALPLTVGLLLSMWRAKRLRWPAIALGAAAALVPLTAYSWVVWRAYHPGGFMWPTLEPSFQGLVRHLTGKLYTVYLGWFSPSKVQKVFLGEYVYPFLFPAMLLSVLAAWRAKGFVARVASWCFVAAIAAGTTYSFAYGVSDPSSYFLMPMILSFVSLAPLLGELSVKSPRAAAVMGLALAILVAALSVPWTQTNLERRRQFIGFNGLLHSMWSSIPSDSGFVFWRDDMFVRLREYQIFGGEKPGMVVMHPVNLTHRIVRQRFRDRFGFDPLEGLDLRMPPVGAAGRIELMNRLLDQVEGRINRLSPLPVIHFDPEIPTVRLLRKQPVDTMGLAAPSDSGVSRR